MFVSPNGLTLLLWNVAGRAAEGEDEEAFELAVVAELVSWAQIIQSSAPGSTVRHDQARSRHLCALCCRLCTCGVSSCGFISYVHRSTAHLTCILSVSNVCISVCLCVLHLSTVSVVSVFRPVCTCVSCYRSRGCTVRLCCICMSVCLCVRMSVCLPVCPSVCPAASNLYVSICVPSFS